MYNEDQLIASISDDWGDKEKIEYIFQFNIHQRSERTLTIDNIHSQWFILYVQNLIQVNDKNKIAKANLIDYMKKAYQGNRLQIERIHQFAEQYKSSDAIKWYTKDFCLYRLINRAFRVADFIALFAMRLFIQDLYMQLSLMYKQQRETRSKSNCSVMRVYRGQYMIKSEKLFFGKNTRVMANSFLSTTMDKDLALGFVQSDNTNERRKAVLLEIEIRTHINSPPYADISSISLAPDEQEILFAPGTIFHYKSAEFDEKTGVNIIQLELYDNADENVRHEDGSETSVATVALVICNMGESKTAETLLLGLLDQVSDDKVSLPLYYFALGYVAYTLDNTDKAASYYETALDITRSVQPDNHVLLAQISDRLAECYIIQNKYESGIALNNYALKLVMELDENPYRLQFLGNYYKTLGRYYFSREQYDSALHYYKVSLVWHKLCYHSVHPLVAVIYQNMGHVHFRMQEYHEALKNFQQFNDIVLKTLPITHPLIGDALYSLAWTKLNLGGSDANSSAYSHFSEAYEIYHYSLPPTNPRCVQVDRSMDIMRVC